VTTHTQLWQEKIKLSRSLRIFSANIYIGDLNFIDFDGEEKNVKILIMEFEV
jgi:hypothetical protein